MFLKQIALKIVASALMRSGFWALLGVDALASISCNSSLVTCNECTMFNEFLHFDDISTERIKTVCHSIFMVHCRLNKIKL